METWTKTKEYEESVVYERRIGTLFQSNEISKELIAVIIEDNSKDLTKA